MSVLVAGRIDLRFDDFMGGKSMFEKCARSSAVPSIHSFIHSLHIFFPLRDASDDN